MVQSKITFLL